MHSPKGANFDDRFSSREAAKNAKEKACDGFSVPSLEEIFFGDGIQTSSRSLRLRVRNAFAPNGGCALRPGKHSGIGGLGDCENALGEG